MLAGMRTGGQIGKIFMKIHADFGSFWVHEEILENPWIKNNKGINI